MTVQGKKYHASAYWYQSDERKAENFYSDILTEERVVFFHLKKNKFADWKNLSDLKGKKIGISRGNTYTAEFLKMCKSKVLTCDEANNDESNIKKLIHGRIEIFPVSETVGFDLVRKSHADKESSIGFLKTPLTVSTGHLLFPKSRKDSQENLKIFNAGLAKLKKSGKYDQFMKDLVAGKYK